MSRHRNFIRIDVDEEREEYNDYGQSVEEDVCLSPTSAQFIWRSGDERRVSDFLNTGRPKVEDVPEETDITEQVSNLSVAPKPSSPLVQKRTVVDRLKSDEQAFQSPQVVIKSAGGRTTAGFSVQSRDGNDDRNNLTPSSSSGNLRSGRASSPAPSMKLNRSSKDMSASASAPATPRLQARPTSSRALLNLVVVGHVDAGKSTLMGHLLYLLDVVNQKTMHKYKQDSQKLGKGSFAFAWVLDEGTEERNRGVTMDIARSHFQTANFDVVLLDAPGHKDFIPNMITGAAQADAALLVVNSTTGEFETGLDFGGQTREHTMLVRSLGVSQLAVVVNKMDTVEWSQQRFEDIQEQLKPFLKQAGFGDCPFVPCCGVGGDNLIATPPSDHALMSWYSGPTLLQVIDSFKAQERSVDRPLRLCVSDVYKGMTTGFCVATKVEVGAVQVGDKLVALPSGECVAAKSIQNHEGAEQTAAFAGDQCSISLIGGDMANIDVGDILCHPESLAPVVSRFEARVVLFNIARPMTRGSQVVVHCNCAQRSAFISKLVSQVNRTSGEVIKNKPRCLGKNTSGVVEITCDKPLCIETYSDCRELGRLTLRCDGVTLGAGIVTKVCCDFTL